jgi:hypothetical protein
MMVGAMLVGATEISGAMKMNDRRDRSGAAAACLLAKR